MDRNALNIVKDDLIVKVDELTGEIEILREELNTANQSRNKLRQRVSDLEDEIKQNKSLVKAHGKLSNEATCFRFIQLSYLTRNWYFQPIPIKRMKAMFRWCNVNDLHVWKWRVFLWNATRYDTIA